MELGVSQEELAHRSGMHRTYYGGIERGERNPSFTNILRLADALDIPASRLLERAEALQAGDGGRRSDAGRRRR